MRENSQKAFKVTAIAKIPSRGESLNFVCPVCRAPVVLEGESYACAQCDRVFPVVFGIPDFRVADDPYISIENDRAKGLRIESREFQRQLERRDRIGHRPERRGNLCHSTLYLSRRDLSGQVAIVSSVFSMNQCSQHALLSVK